MDPQRTRPPVVLIMLPDSRAPRLDALAPGHPQASLRLDAADRIDAAELAGNRVLQGIVRKTKESGGRLHLIGLVSDGGLHSSLPHLHALIEVARQARVRVVVHALLDGVDTPPRSAPRFIAELEARLEGGVGRIGTVSGRHFGMDADGHWDRLEKVYRAITADGVDRLDSALHGIEEACAFGNPEAFVKPFVVFDYPGVSLVDRALHFNFGMSQARALTLALAGARFSPFTRKGGRAPFEGRYACMTPYDTSLDLPTLFARAPDPLSLPLEQLARAGCRTLQCAEGTVPAIASAAEAAIRGGEHGLVIVDFANPENPAELGSEAAVQGALQRLLEQTRAVAGAALVLAGRDADNQLTVHYLDETTPQAQLRSDGELDDVAATVLDLLQLRQPADVPGTSLLVR